MAVAHIASTVVSPFSQSTCRRRALSQCRPEPSLGRAGSTSVMWRIADGGGVEQLDGSFLYQRTHTLDPQETVASSRSGRSRTNNDAAASCDGRSPQRLGRENMLTRFPSGSRSKSERLPHGINVVGITMFVPDAFIRSNTASTSSTSNSRIAD